MATGDNVTAITVALSQLRKLMTCASTVEEAMNECLLATALAPKLIPNCSKEELVDVLQAFVREKTEQREHEKLTMKWIFALDEAFSLVRLGLVESNGRPVQSMTIFNPL